MHPDLKIEVGKFYKTRDGRKARIYAVDGGTIYLGNIPHPYHGAVYHPNNGWIANTWNEKGRGITGRDSDTHEVDLIAEWRDPEPRRLAWIDKKIGGVHFGLPHFKFVEEGWERAPWLDEPEGK